MTFSEWLHNKRTENEYTLQELADKAGTSKSYIWEIENDKANPTLETVIKIAGAFGLEGWRALKQAGL